MSNDGSVLPQAEIDALFKQATGKDIAPLPAAEPAAPSKIPLPSASPATPSAGPSQRAGPAAPIATPVQTVTSAPSDDVLKTIQATVADLAQRMTKLEMNINVLSRQERKVPDVSGSIQRLSQRLEAVVKDLQRVNSHVVGVSRGLEGTLGYDIRNSFTCGSCGSHGFVAIPMRCTECDSEGWWGWWPKEK